MRREYETSEYADTPRGLAQQTVNHWFDDLGTYDWRNRGLPAYLQVAVFPPQKSYITAANADEDLGDTRMYSATVKVYHTPPATFDTPRMIAELEADIVKQQARYATK